LGEIKMAQNEKQNFIDWLKFTLPASAGKYSGAIDTITKELKKYNLIARDIYSISNSDEIDEIINKYLSVHELRQKNITGNNMYSAALKKYKEFLKLENQKYDLYVSKNDIDKEIKSIEDNLEKIKEKERLSIIKSRIGQSNFKRGLVKKYEKCLLCDIDMPELLIASHIKPWSKSNDNEKLDLNNGLLICCLHDKLFDLGLISFNDSGKIEISNKIDKSLYSSLKIEENQGINVNVNVQTIEYLTWHNKNIFK
jgi:predicted restriction endonuclease